MRWIAVALIVLTGCANKPQLVVKHDFSTNNTQVEVRITP